MKIRVNETLKTIDEQNELVTVYEYDECEVSDNPTRAELISAIIALVYSESSEMAKINNYIAAKDDLLEVGDERIQQYIDYQNYRKMAYEIAENLGV